MPLGPDWAGASSRHGRCSDLLAAPLPACCMSRLADVIEAKRQDRNVGSFRRTELLERGRRTKTLGSFRLRSLTRIGQNCINPIALLHSLSNLTIPAHQVRIRLVCLTKIVKRARHKSMQ